MRLTSLLALALCCAPLAAQDPAPPPSIDQLAAEVVAIRTKRAELDRSESEKLGAIAAELKRQRELLEKLGLDGPAPKPPVPVPPPAPPAPADPIKAKLKAAYDADQAPADARRSQALDLAALYRQAAGLAKDSTVTSAGDLLARVRDAGKALVGADSLKEVRRVAGAELGALLPTDAVLTDEQRSAAAALFAKLAAALDEIAR